MGAAFATSPPKEAAHFLAIPWCAAHLTPDATSTGSITYWTPPWTRASANRKSTGDQFFGQTLNTADTVSHFLVFFPTPADRLGGGSSKSSSSSSTAVAGANDGGAARSPEALALIPEVKALIALEHGLSGWPGAAHGGAIMTVLDEIMGLICTVNRQRGSLNSRPVMTGYLNTRFLRPVPTNAVVLVVVRIVKVEDRKVWVEGSIEDKDGNQLTKAEAVFIMLLRPPRL
ncbi:HotDog domain-containing protein [Xylariales sp. PMI_506]|nr:HotDog domain-containing protein [Xylariales sp. PMI_506]